MSRHAILAGVLAIGAAGAVALEAGSELGGGAVDRSTVSAPVHKVVIDAEDGSVRLSRSTGPIDVYVKRHHVVNTPRTTQTATNGVLTLRTTCPLGFVGCRTDYRVGVPEGVDVEVRKASGRVDAVALGGVVTDVSDDLAPVRTRVATGTLTVAAR